MAPLLVQIRRWLKQPHVWRFVGLASTVVGLSCYALSSSSNYLFGGWNLLKTSVYSVFSIIVCLSILFAKVWQHSRSLRLKAHLAFLVLTITSVYSFFFDKAVNGKPDAYSIVSCVAFAVMSLSLSRQTQCGFEVDLLYFFSGALIVQLMKIKLLLGVIGVGVSYFLIILRSFVDAPLDSEHLIFQDQSHLVVQLDSDSQQANTDIALIIPQLTSCLEALKSNNDMLSRYVAEYMRNCNDKDHIPIDNNLVIDALQPEVINNLHEVVKLMVAAGFEKECCDMYSSCRRECIEQCLPLLRVQRLNIEDLVKTGAMSLEYVIQIWIKTSNVAIRFLFPNERRLCQRVFMGFSAAADLAFTEVCTPFTIRQLNLANSFAVERTIFKTLEVLPRIPKVFKILHDLIPEYELLFSEPSSDSIRNEAIHTRKRLGKATKDIFKELEDWICHDKAMADLPGGLYPISCEVMNCLCDICEAWDTLGLEKVFEEHPMVGDREGTSSSFSVQLTRVIELLDRHLEVKYKNCTDPALCYVFMITNERYIEKKAIECQSRISTIFQDGMIRELNARVKQNIENYRRSSWDKVIGLLKQVRKESTAVESMKENIKLFNMYFKEICRVQSTWLVLDEPLRKEIIESVRKILFPAYQNYVTKLYCILSWHAAEYLEYSVYEIDAPLNELFRGKQLRN